MSPTRELPLPHTLELFSQFRVYMNTLFINIIGHFFFKRKTKLQKKCIKKKNSRHAGLLKVVRRRAPAPARMADCGLQVLASRHVCRCSILSARAPRPAPPPAGLGAPPPAGLGVCPPRARGGLGTHSVDSYPAAARPQSSFCVLSSFVLTSGLFRTVLKEINLGNPSYII